MKYNYLFKNYTHKGRTYIIPLRVEIMKEIVASLAGFQTTIEERLIDEERFDIDFQGHLMVQVEREYEEVATSELCCIGFKVINAVDGYGNNVAEKYKGMLVELDLTNETK